MKATQTNGEIVELTPGCPLLDYQIVSIEIDELDSGWLYTALNERPLPTTEWLKRLFGLKMRPKSEAGE